MLTPEEKAYYIAKHYQENYGFNPNPIEYQLGNDKLNKKLWLLKTIVDSDIVQGLKLLKNERLVLAGIGRNKLKYLNYIEQYCDEYSAHFELEDIKLALIENKCNGFYLFHSHRSENSTPFPTQIDMAHIPTLKKFAKEEKFNFYDSIILKLDDLFSIKNMRFYEI